MEELWKPINNFEGFYEISSFGRVKSLVRGKVKEEKILTPNIDGWGYRRACLCKNGVEIYIKLHRLVATYFIPNPDNLPEVNHLDEDKTNNRVDNLEWCSSHYNTNYGERNKKISESRKNMKFTEEHKANISKSKSGISLNKELIKLKASNTPVIQLNLQGEVLNKFYCIREAERITGVDRVNISKCCNSKRKTAGGFRWNYFKLKNKNYDKYRNSKL